MNHGVQGLGLKRNIPWNSWILGGAVYHITDRGRPGGNLESSIPNPTMDFI